MEIKILSHLGRAAGLAGIALGVLLLVFQGVLQKQFLPQAGLGPTQALAVMLSLMILTFGVAGIGVVAWLVGRTGRPKASVPAPTIGLLAALIVLVLASAVYVGTRPDSDFQPSSTVEAGGGGVAIGGNVSGSTINVGTTTGSESNVKPK
jgi:amino acid transporter